MKNLFLLAVLVGSVTAFVGSAEAQRVRLHIYLAPSDPSPVRVSGRITSVAVDPGDPATVYRWDGGRFKRLSAGSSTEPVAFPAGRTARIHIDPTDNGGPLVRKSSVPISYEVPCGGEPPAPATGVTTSSLTMTGEVVDTDFNWQTEQSWKGTCRMMVVELTDRREYAIKVRFE
jgi:hypothetical protein